MKADRYPWFLAAGWAAIAVGVVALAVGVAMERETRP